MFLETVGMVSYVGVVLTLFAGILMGLLGRNPLKCLILNMLFQIIFWITLSLV